MEYIDGPNLRQLTRSGHVAPREALQLIRQMDEGVVHRDIKPENVMIDFGLAKLLGREPENLHLTGAKDIMGTPHYMAPEQMEKPAEVDHRADIYSLGVVFYELLTRELPLGKFTPPSEKVQVDVRLDEVVLHTLEREPARRYQHASQVKSDVETIAQTPVKSTLRHPGPTSEQGWFEDARRQLKGRAIGLVVTAVLNWMVIPLITVIMIFAATRPISLLVPLGGLLLSSVMLAAGLEMKRLQAYWLAVAGSVLAVIVTPGNIVGLPIGIWSLVVLSQRRVRASFGKEFLPPAPLQGTQSADGGAWSAIAVVVVAVVLLVAIPVGALMVSIALPALSRAKAAARSQIQYLGEEQQVAVQRFKADQVSDALDLDTGRLVGLPASATIPEMISRVSEHGVDLMVDRIDNRWGLITPDSNGLTMTLVPNEAWAKKVVSKHPVESGTAITETIRRHGLVVQLISTNVSAPITFYFRTSNGTNGLIRIPSLESSDHLKLGFKLAK